MSRGHFFLFCWNERFWVKTRAIMAFGQKKKKEKQEAVFSVFLPLLKALSDDICLTLKLKNSFNPFLRQPLWRHNFAFCFQQRWHLWGVVWSHCDWIHNISVYFLSTKVNCTNTNTSTNNTSKLYLYEFLSLMTKSGFLVGLLGLSLKNYQVFSKLPRNL